MRRTVTDPTFGKGRLMALDLRDVVDDDQSDQYRVGRYLEEDGGRETSREHPKVQGFIIKQPFCLSTIGNINYFIRFGEYIHMMYFSLVS